MQSDFLRQRRNLLLISVITMFYYIGDVRLEGITRSGVKIGIQNEIAVPIFLWSLFVYFLYRYWVHYHYYDCSLEVFLKKRFPKPTVEITAEEREENRKEIEEHDIFQNSSFQKRFYNFASEIIKKGIAQQVISSYEIVNDKEFSNYQLPFVVALLTVFIGAIYEENLRIKILTSTVTIELFLYFVYLIDEIIKKICKYLEDVNTGTAEEKTVMHDYLIKETYYFKFFKKVCICKRNITLCIFAQLLLIFFIFVLYSVFNLI